MKKDIAHRKDIELLVTRFYDMVKQDDQIGFIFNDVAKVNWEKHLPVMFDFWENILFATGSYNGNPMVAHARLHEKSPLTADHFNRWKEIWVATVDEHFEGDVAELARQRALSIATVMHIKVAQSGRPSL